ncbi:unnamed protein product [Candidula unifasciata]|uniref:Uncharacterized protein n=1 Tax=Candidula unifasciata TaxID=100452 RepID=A0A8S3ZJS3_9EUPU|nr:unnamed protein product [Candidula unifasciata]
MFILAARSLVIVCAIFISQSLEWDDIFKKTLNHFQCWTVKRISLVCYRCAKRHSDDFRYFYVNCCSGPDNKFRSYCEDIYTAPPENDG